MDGVLIKPSDTLELLGVEFGRKCSTGPHKMGVAKAATQRAALVAPMSLHIPQGGYLRQLSVGLLMGKLSHAVGAVTELRLTRGTPSRHTISRSKGQLTISHIWSQELRGQNMSGSRTFWRRPGYHLIMH